MAGIVLSNLMIYVLSMNCFQVELLAPIKRPLSRENTSPSQKMIFFFAGTSSIARSVPYRCLHSGFQNLLVQITKKDIRLDFRLRECNGVPTKKKGFELP